VDDWLVQAQIMKQAVQVHPVITIFALMAGGKLFGTWGLMFALPVMCMVKVSLKVAWQWYASEYGLTSPLVPASQIPIV